MTDHMNPPGTEAEFKLGKPYTIPTDAEWRFREYARHAFETCLRETWARLEGVLTMFPVEPTDPPSGLARDGDYYPKLRDEIHSRLLDLDGCTNQATAEELVNAVVGPELDRHIGAHRRDNQRHANLTQWWSEQLKSAEAECDRLRSELADMTTQRDAIRSPLLAACADAEVDKMLITTREVARFVAGQVIRLHTELDTEWARTDAAIRRAEAAEAEVKAMRQDLSDVTRLRNNVSAEADRLEAERDEARSWARHGYEIGQRSATWADHGVAPPWLTEGHDPAALSPRPADDSSEADTGGGEQ